MAYLKFKVCRRLGENICLNKKLTPKQHAIIRLLIKKNTNRKQSDFSNKLQQIKKLAYFYGMRSLSNHTTSIQAPRGALDKKKSLLLALEVRLDVILVRIHFCPTLQSARQFITHNKIYVNFHVVNTPGFRLRNGDIISILPRHVELVQSNIKELLKPTNGSLDSHPQNFIVPSYNIEVNYKTCNALLLYEPVEIHFPYKIDLDFIF